MERRIRKRKAEELPEDLIGDEILPRLPAEILVRFRCVCKSWLFLFSDPQFIKSHLTHQKSNGPDYLIGKTYFNDNGVNIVSRFNGTHVEALSATAGDVIGSINGLGLFLRFDKFWLWNPMLRQYKEIRLTSEFRHLRNCKHVYGFGWDPVGNDYKVVVVCVTNYVEGSSKCVVYSSNSNSWSNLIVDSRFSVNSVFQNRSYLSTPITVVKECPYWSYSKFVSVTGKKYRRRYTALFKFVAKDNEFKWLPDFDNSITRGKVFKLVNMNDCLAGMTYKQSVNSFLDVYVLHEDCGVWSKMYTVGPIDVPLERCYLSKGFIHDSEIVFYNTQDFHCYDLKTNKKKDDVLHSAVCLVVNFGYTPSLVVLEGMEPISSKTKDIDNMCPYGNDGHKKRLNY